MIKLIIGGIEAHSRRTDFIERKLAKEGRDLSVSLPRPEGVLEYVILSDADILTQSKLEQGVKKIICSRLMFEGFRKQDEINGVHKFAKTLDSVIDSAQKGSNAMHFDSTKEKAREQLAETEQFRRWLEAGNKIQAIDEVRDFAAKKQMVDGLIQEFAQLPEE